jgi:hypothetical protein
MLARNVTLKDNSLPQIDFISKLLDNSKVSRNKAEILKLDLLPYNAIFSEP